MIGSLFPYGCFMVALALSKLGFVRQRHPSRMMIEKQLSPLGYQLGTVTRTTCPSPTGGGPKPTFDT